MNSHQRRIKERIIERRLKAYVKWLRGVVQRHEKFKEGSESNG